jgi:hypothetical protein
MRAFVVGCLLCASVGSTLPVNATQVQQLSFEQLGAAATKVVRGKIETQHSYWNPQHTKIFTEIVLAAEETYKGSDANSVRIVQLGGTVDGVRVTVHGALGWTPGEEVLLFLEPYKDDSFVVSGLSQGKFNILRDPQTNEAFVTRLPLEGLELVEPNGAKAIPADVEKIPLNQFVHQALGTDPEPHQD